LGNSFLFEDDAGLQRLSFDYESLTLASEPVLPDACRLQRSPSVSGDVASLWLALQMPCGNPKPSLVQLDQQMNVRQQHELELEADARYARALVPLGRADGEPAPLAGLYLTDVAEDGLGTLWAFREGDPAPIKLGERAELDSAVALPSTGWDGLVQVNYQQLGSYTAFDWLHFRWSGETEIVAEHVVQKIPRGEVLVNFDGVAGDVPQFDEDGLHLVAEDVSPNVRDAASYLGTRRYARVDLFDGDSGRLQLTKDPASAQGFEELGSGVTPEAVRFSWFMPALLFLERWNKERQTGSLVAYNYELDARTTIAEDVSSFDLTSYPWDGVVYTVPQGSRRGLWFSRAK
jgi:hypothetical protein